MKYLTVRNARTLKPEQTISFLSFSCQEGLSQYGQNNSFMAKTTLNTGLLEIGTFLQLETSNWAGKITSRDIDYKAKTITYTGTSLCGYLDRFIPFLYSETITAWGNRSYEGDSNFDFVWYDHNVLTQQRAEELVNQAITASTPLGLKEFVDRINQLAENSKVPIQIKPVHLYPEDLQYAADISNNRKWGGKGYTPFFDVFLWGQHSDYPHLYEYDTNEVLHIRRAGTTPSYTVILRVTMSGEATFTNQDTLGEIISKIVSDSGSVPQSNLKLRCYFENDKVIAELNNVVTHNPSIINVDAIGDAYYHDTDVPNCAKNIVGSSGYMLIHQTAKPPEEYNWHSRPNNDFVVLDSEALYGDLWCTKVNDGAPSLGFELDKQSREMRKNATKPTFTTTKDILKLGEKVELMSAIAPNINQAKRVVARKVEATPNSDTYTYIFDDIKYEARED